MNCVQKNNYFRLKEIRTPFCDLPNYAPETFAKFRQYAKQLNLTAPQIAK